MVPLDPGTTLSVIDKLLSVLPAFIRVVKDHTTSGRCKNAEKLIKEAREVMEPVWAEMTSAEKERLRGYIDL